MQQLSRAKRTEIQKYNKEKFETWLGQYAVENYKAGVRQAYMALLFELHDKFGFGNERIQRFLKASEPWMQALINGKEGIDVDGIKQPLIDEGIVCLKSTDL